MATTYTLISSNVLSSSAASVTFSSIPATYTDLVLRASIRTDDAGVQGAQFRIRFNGDTATNYSRTQIYGNSGAVTSNRTTNGSFLGTLDTNGAGSASNTFSNAEIYIPNYTGTANKPTSNFGVSEDNNANGVFVGANAGLYRGSSAITSIGCYVASINFVSGSSFDLYGIKNS